MRTIAGKLKRAAKRVVPAIMLRNVSGCAGALRSYYPDYLVGKGEVRSLSKVCIEVTFKCNCRCQMCPLYGLQTGAGAKLTRSIADSAEVTTKQYQELFFDLKTLGTKSINFTGGEPFLRKDVLELTRLAKDLGIGVSFTTNGGVITREMARRIVELGTDCVSISLDGPKALHETIRNAKIFDHIMNVVDWIKEEQVKQRKETPNLSFTCTLSALNQNHLEELVDVAYQKAMPLTIGFLIFTTEEHNAATRKSFEEAFIKEESFVMPAEIGAINTEKLEEELHRVAAKARRLKVSAEPAIVGRTNRQRYFNDPQFSVVGKCLAPWSSARIDPYGTVYPCSLSVPMGNIQESRITEIVNGEKYVNFRRKLKKSGLFPFCMKCCVLRSDHVFWDLLPKW